MIQTKWCKKSLSWDQNNHKRCYKKKSKGKQDLPHDWNKNGAINLLWGQDNHTIFIKREGKWMFFENILKFC